MPTVPVALQMYTVRDDAARDFAGTLRQVAAIGYRGVELAGYGGLTIDAVHHELDALGLRAAGSHIALTRLENELSRVVAECQTLGCTHVVCPFLPPERRTESAYRALTHSLNAIGATLQREGLILCYHNHAFEFETEIDGFPAYDWLLSNTDAASVQIELDVYWVQKSGRDPVAYLDRLAGRVPLVHLKDITRDERATFAPVGTGTIAFDPIFASAERGGAAWYIIEQDQSDGPAIEAAGTSWQNLQQMGKV